MLYVATGSTVSAKGGEASLLEGVGRSPGPAAYEPKPSDFKPKSHKPRASAAFSSKTERPTSPRRSDAWKELPPPLCAECVGDGAQPRVDYALCAIPVVGGACGAGLVDRMVAG